MRVCHYIKPNARSESPTRAIWFQAWTYKVQTVGFQTDYGYEFIRICRGVKDTKTGVWSFTWYMVTHAEAFWKYLDHLTIDKTKTYLICQDPSMHLPLIQAFSVSYLSGWKLTLAIIPPAPTICRWRKGDKSVVLLGASNIWPTLFATHSTGATECWHAVKSDEFEPCAHVKQIDSEITVLRDKTIAWWTFLRQNDLGGFSPTAGSQSFRVWRHRYMTHRVLIDCHDDALALAREAIYGARCELFRHCANDIPVYECDSNGSYGGIMRDMRVPIRLLSFRRHFTIAELFEWVRRYVCVARVDIDCPQPVFPLRGPHGLAFVSGRRVTVLAGEELRYALECGWIKDAYEVAIYEDAPAFSTYMQALWIMRKASESVGKTDDAEKYKLLMASFFGRWAQRGRVWEKVRDADSMAIRSWIDINADTQEVTEWRQFGGIVQKLNDDTESRESSPAIAACILAGGRMQLWHWMQKAGLDNVYYVDTDSLFTNQVGFLRLRDDIDPHVLGKLKVKGTYDSATFLGPKHIVVGGIVRHAGVSQRGLYDSEGTVHQTQSKHVATWIRSGEMPRASSTEVTKAFKKGAC